MPQKKQAVIFASLVIALTSWSVGQESDPDYKIQGEYAGDLVAGGEQTKIGIQVIALGEGKFTGVVYSGGLPGDGWNRKAPTRIEDVPLENGMLKLGTHELSQGVVVVKDTKGKRLGQLERIVRTSPTLGAKAPAGATILFDGSSVENWERKKGEPAEMTDDGLLVQGAFSKKKFQDHVIHIEFLLPFQPEARGQQRGNSGIYLQGRYEVQMLDSFGLTGEQNECGGIYTIRKPDQNMCFPPLQWQTYDIEFHAAKFDGDKKIENAWATVKHNGVTIHEKVELPKSTTAAPMQEGAGPGYVYLQNHGNPVRYRNIWVEELGEEK